MHLPATALPGAPVLYSDPAGQAIAAQVFGRRAVLPWAPGPLLVAGGDVIIASLGAGLQVREGGSAARMGAATLVAGSITVNTAAVAANSRILLSGQNTSGTAGELTISARVAGASFTISSTSGTDTRLIAWFILSPAA